MRRRGPASGATSDDRSWRTSSHNRDIALDGLYQKGDRSERAGPLRYTAFMPTPAEPTWPANSPGPRPRIGASSWSAESWEGVFYPIGMRPTDYLAHYASQ